MSMKSELVSARVRCANRATRTLFDRDFWVDLATLSELDRARVRLLAEKRVASACFVYVRSLFAEGQLPTARFGSCQCLDLSGYFEDEVGNPLDELQLVKLLRGDELPILDGIAESVLRLGPAPILRSELWNAETANTIAHFLQLIEVIGSGDWLNSALSISTPGSSSRINSFECPDLGQMYSVFLPIRQLYAHDKAFDHACNLYMKHVGDERKRDWIKRAKRRFHSYLDSVPPGPFQLGNHTVKDLLDIVLYGAGLVHYHESGAAT